MAELFYDNGVEFYHPFLPYDDDDRMVEELHKFFSGKRKIDIDRVRNTDIINKFKTDTRDVYKRQILTLSST